MYYDQHDILTAWRHGPTQYGQRSLDSPCGEGLAFSPSSLTHRNAPTGRCAMDRRRPSLLSFPLLLVLCGLVLAAGPLPARADEVTDWNVIAIDVLTLAGHNNIVMTRGLAMAHLATHDALNAIDRRYEPYLFDRRSEPGGAPGAAVAAAMRDALIGALAGFGSPEQQAKAKERAESAYAAALAKIPD